MASWQGKQENRSSVKTNTVSNTRTSTSTAWEWTTYSDFSANRFKDL